MDAYDIFKGIGSLLFALGVGEIFADVLKEVMKDD